MKVKAPKLPKFEIKLVRSERGSYEPIALRTPVDAEKFLGFLKTSDREQFVVLMLTAQHEIMGYNVVSVGTLSASLVHMREVFKPAILSNAFAILVAHNHPSGNPTPSREDIQVTSQLIEAGALLGISVLDHLVIGDTTVSLRETRPELWG